MSGVQHALQGRIQAHRRTMQGTYFGALIVAGSFAFLPGRIMHEIIFADGLIPASMLLAIAALAGSI